MVPSSGDGFGVVCTAIYIDLFRRVCVSASPTVDDCAEVVRNLVNCCLTWDSSVSGIII